MQDHSYSGHSLESNVTPWWWTRHWDSGSSPQIRDALGVLISLSVVEVEELSITRTAVTLKLAVADEADIEKIRKEADDIRWFLDDMVKYVPSDAEMAPLVAPARTPN